jgi:hypothetical protein
MNERSIHVLPTSVKLICYRHCHSAHRCERFDTVIRWRERLRTAGFRTHPLLTRIASRHIATEPDNLMTTIFQDGYVGFAHEGYLVTAVMCAY